MDWFEATYSNIGADYTEAEASHDALELLAEELLLDAEEDFYSELID